MPITTLTISLDSEEKSIIAGHAAALGTSVSEFMRRSALERIEDDLDAKAWEAAKAAFDADPVAIPSREIARKYL